MNGSPERIRQAAARTIRLESETVAALAGSIDAAFISVVQLLLSSPGRLVVTGIGKSAIIAQKLVATFNSTGQPSLFMHAADAIHGDLGIIQGGDAVLCISKSGDSPEIKVLVPLVKSMGNPLIAMVAHEKSFLAQHADWVLHTPVEREACPNNLAPTSSTAAQLAFGDALAVALMECRGFSADDFARVHPGGALGRKLYTRVGDLLREDACPRVGPDTPGIEVLVEISDKRLGATAVLGGDKILGIITDGDIRRLVEKGVDIREARASDMMVPHPKTIAHDELAVEGFRRMESHHITQLIVTREGAYAGIIHLHDILREGIF